MRLVGPGTACRCHSLLPQDQTPETKTAPDSLSWYLAPPAGFPLTSTWSSRIHFARSLDKLQTLVRNLVADRRLQTKSPFRIRASDPILSLHRNRDNLSHAPRQTDQRQPVLSLLWHVSVPACDLTSLHSSRLPIFWRATTRLVLVASLVRPTTAGPFVRLNCVCPASPPRHHFHHSPITNHQHLETILDRYSALLNGKGLLILPTCHCVHILSAGCCKGPHSDANCFCAHRPVKPGSLLFF